MSIGSSVIGVTANRLPLPSDEGAATAPVVSGAALFLGMSSLGIVGLLSDSGLLLLVAVVYAITMGTAMVVLRGRAATLFCLSATVGAALLGLVSFGAALIPSLLLWLVAWRATGGRMAPRMALVTTLAGLGAGFWVVLVPLAVARW